MWERDGGGKEAEGDGRGFLTPLTLQVHPPWPFLVCFGSSEAVFEDIS